MIVDGKPKQTKKTDGQVALMLSREQKDEECDATKA